MSAVLMNQAPPCVESWEMARVGGGHGGALQVSPHRAFSQFGIPKVNILLTPVCLCRDRLVHLSANGPEGLFGTRLQHMHASLTHAHIHTYTPLESAGTGKKGR